MAHCGHCSSPDVEVELDTFGCLSCGGSTDMAGNALPRRPQFLVPSFQERREAGEVQ